MCTIKTYVVTLLVLPTLLGLSITAWGQDDTLYRYTDNKGTRVISSQIPARYVSKGYDIISQEGKLIRRVDPEPSAQEKEKIQKQRAEQQRLNKWDAELLRRYSHPDDIKDAKRRKLAQNRNDLGIIRRNIEKIDEEINRYQGLAAADEREGREISQDTLDIIEQLKRQRAKEKENEQEKQMERSTIEQKFDGDIARFKIIRPETAKP
ncbi:MAG: hypothetical protein ACRBCI_03415 [Cellvibrionaceae bacterium]